MTRKPIIPMLILAATTVGTVLVSSSTARSNPLCRRLGRTLWPTVLVSPEKAPSDRPAPLPPQTSETKVIAYYFHVNVRCTTCRAIESYSREVIERKLGAEIAKGRLQFKLVNIQLEENRHFVKDYQLFTKSLVLVRFDKGRRAEFKILNDTWELVGNKSAMQGYVEREVRDYLKRLS
jgi:hypothetical protein